MRHPKVYLSPSRQPNNIYAWGNTNEEKEMVEIAVLLKKILTDEYGIETVLADLNLDIGARGRPREAKEKGCSIYLAIHSNAGGGGKAQGAVALFHPLVEESRSLGRILVEELDALCPFKSNRTASLVDGMKAFQGKGYGEIRTPQQFGLVPVLMETNFHDHAEIAKWMAGNKKAIAESYGKALARYLQVEKTVKGKTDISQCTEASEKDAYYRVQVGAYRKIENAEEMKAKLWSLGFEGFITYR